MGGFGHKVCHELEIACGAELKACMDFAKAGHQSDSVCPEGDGHWLAAEADARGQRHRGALPGGAT